MRVPLFPLAVALLLAAAGCISKDPLPEMTSGAELEPTDFAPDANASSASTARTGSNASASSSGAASSNASSSASASGANASAAPADPAAPVAAPLPVVTRWDGSITGASAGPADAAPVPVCCPTAEAAGENTAVSFDVPAGLSAIVVELAWTQGTPPADLDLVLDAADVAQPVPPVDGTTPATRTGHWWTDGAGTPADTTATARIVVTDAEALAIVARGP